ncbi:GH25 family lysozyme [Lacticaseibacillus camelliae]|nr:GH25 family lysozyme [Lacticaseibacillus camelliae]
MTTVTDAGAGVEKTLSVFDLNMHANNQQNDSQNHTMGGVLTDEALKASIDSSGSTSSLHYLRMPASMPEASVSEWVKVAQQVATADRMKTGRTQEIILTDATVATVQIGSSSIPRVDAVDVSSYQDWMTQADFTKLKRLGVSTVIVKVTEGSSYTNSAAKTQIAYAKAAGLKVDVYDYIRFTSASQAQAEARYTASAMEGLGLSKATLIFADIEENSVPAADLTNYWSALNAAGYRNHGVYTGGGYAESATAIASVGSAKTWYAQYPDTPSASSLWDTSYGAWQFSSSAQIPGGSTSGMVDVSHDYQGLLKGSSTVAAQGPWIADNQYVTVTHTGYPLYSDFNWTVKQPISNVYHKTYHATGQYHHQNGSTYLSLYDNGGRWQGYINVKGVDVSGGQQGVHFADDRYVTFTHSGYPLYSSFAWDVRHSGSSVYQNTYHSTGIYHHFNGATYLSLYNGIGAWMGYVNANAVSVASGQQGLWQAKSGYLMANSSADTIWSSFNFTKGVKTTKGKYLRVNGMYHHANGSVYYSVYDPNTGAWKGYLNAKAGSFQTTAAGPKQPDNRYVTVTHTGYPLYSSWNWAIIHTGSSVYHQTFHSTGIYHHINGGTYLSLYDVNGIWAGWINANAVEVGSGQQGPWFADNRRVKVTHVGYPLYSNWNWSVRHTGSSVYGRTFKSTGKYYHFNGSTYLSLYDNSGAWYGYMNANGVEVVR